MVPLHGRKTSQGIAAKTRSIFSQLTAKVILGHHRLKIIDLSDHSHQPFISSDSKVAMTFNGEIYNYKELRVELSRKGHSFSTQGDTEVALKAYLEWGTDCFERFNGMWAIGIFDGRSNTLVLSRDHFGIKPLFYSRIGEQVAFASEVRFIKALAPSLSLNHSKAVEYLNSGRIHYDEETLFEEVKSVKPGSFITFGQDLRSSERVYWKVTEGRSSLGYEEAVEELERLFCNSIDLRLRSDVPLGALLSGGLDSTAIVSNILARHSVEKFSAFTAVFDEEKFSERRYVEKTIERYPRIDWHLVKPRPKDLLEEVERLLELQEFPFRSLAVYSQYKIYESVRRDTDIVVLLNGQGSDEIFGGYTQHYYFYFLDLVLGGDYRRFSQEAKAFLKNRGQHPGQLLKGVTAAVSELFNAGSVKNSLGWNKVKTPYKSPRLDHGNNSLGSILLTNLRSYSLPEYLLYEDKNSMAFSLESRLPFLDHRLVEFAFTLDNALKINHQNNKYILREASKAYVPLDILERKDKMGFVSPQELWQRGELADTMKEVICDGNPVYNFSSADLESGLEKYVKGKDSDWAFWWRIYCFKKWRSLDRSNRPASLLGAAT